MTAYRSAAAAIAAISLLTVASADACPVYIEPKLTDARQADAVVVGYVTKDVRETSPARKAWVEKWLANHPDAPRAKRRDVRSATDRARLTVEINHTIAGTVPSTVTVFWSRMTNNGPPERISGGYVFALRKLPPSTAADGIDAYVVIQGVCSGALVFRRGSTEANAIREMFGLWPEPLEAPRKSLAELTRDAPIPGPALVVLGLLATSAAFAGVALWRRRRRS
ncbi:hypothetical protein [uncultured Brevundimonas sp.]|uniref:hypothetical protein n=1 Tax=uncultured Brevundimonas sp. TaxID=213418 RepID=UPI0030EEDA44|tara:strand:+ start:2192 stop:2863 length:672 start_codon:yes stop_codon:yes gene_type:complete